MSIAVCQVASPKHPMPCLLSLSWHTKHPSSPVHFQPMSGRLLDEGMNQVSDRRWQVKVLPHPDISTNDSGDRVTISDFLAGVCRRLDRKAVKSASVIMDSHVGIVECGSANTIGKLVAEGKLAELPPPLRFSNMPPATSKVDIIIENTGDGCMNVLKILYLEKTVPSKAGISFCSGTPLVPVFRNGPHAVKKALQWALDRVRGHHVHWHSLQDKSSGSLTRSTSTTWSPETDDLSEGIRFINLHAPECDARNEQTFWILTHIRPDSGSPIAGWPEVKVRGMAQNKSRGVSGAQSMTEFPLNTYNLKDDLVKHILPLLYPLLLTTAVIIAGNPGVGKTPTVIAMAMAIGRFHIERLGLQGVLPGWRRAKSLDNFRQRAPQIQEAIFLDDPSKRKVDVADLKAFVTVDEDGTVEGRYCDARLLRNQMRAYASNDTGEDPKDTKPGDTTLSTDSFMKLVHPLFGDAHIKDKLAVLKRSTVLVFTGSALYLRFPSENPDFVIHRIVQNDLHKDLLEEECKPVYNMYKSGVLVYAPEYQAQVNKEQEMIKASVETMSSFSSRDEYVSHCNTQVQAWLRPPRHLPASPDDASDEDPDAQRASMGLPPVFPAIGNGLRPNRLGTFSYPSPAKRLRVKTTSIERFPETETNQDINLAADPGMTADEEAARHMHN